MPWDLTHIPQLLRPALEEKLGTRLISAAEISQVPLDLPLVWACSDFVADSCRRDPTLVPWLASGQRLHAVPGEAELHSDLASGIDPAGDDNQFMAALRCFRRRQLVRTRRDGQSIYYSLASGQAASVINTLHEQFCGRR